MPTSSSVTLPSGTDIYNAIMREIEPDLVTDAIATLGKKYAGESAAQKQNRLERYRSAYQKYDEVYEEWMKKFKSEVTRFKRTAFASAEARSEAEDAKAMADLESQMTVTA